MTGPLEYWDSAMDSPGKAREADPIDDVIDWLKLEDFSCLGTQHVSWNSDGTQGTASDRNDVRERYVIECDGDCCALHYLPALQATMFHFAATQPVPVAAVLRGERYDKVTSKKIIKKTSLRIPLRSRSKKKVCLINKIPNRLMYLPRDGIGWAPLPQRMQSKWRDSRSATVLAGKKCPSVPLYQDR